MPDPADVCSISVTVRRDWRSVYDFACVPENFARWASGLGRSLRHEGAHWVADAPEGPATVRFTERNAYGVLDHHVVLPSGAELYMPARVIGNGDGAEVVFTLFRPPGASDDAFARDAEWIARDLDALRTLLETDSST